MNQHLSVEVRKPYELDAAARAAWAQFTQGSVATPFLSLQYIEAAARVVPNSYVAVIRQDGEIVAFFPFQRRGRAIQSLGAPMTDYQGVIARPGCQLELAWLVHALGARNFSFSGLHGEGEYPNAITRLRLSADLSQGFAAYAADRRSRFGKYWKDKERMARYLERDLGKPVYALHEPLVEVLDWLIALKRNQYAENGQYDIFSCGWTQALLSTLLAQPTAEFGGMISTLRVGSRLLAASYSLRCGSNGHLWFPVYDPEFARYAPGALLTINLLRLAAERGVTNVDFGPGPEPYKKYFTDPGQAVWEGSVSGHCRPAQGVVPPAVRRGPDDWRLKIARRYRVMAACEPSPAGVLAASAAWAYSVARRQLSA